MPKKRLTAQMIDRMPVPAKGQVEYYDRNMPGFALRISYSGTRSWTLMTRVHGKLTRLTLGEWPSMGLAEAHDAARTARSQVKGGSDPREIQKQTKADAKDAQRLTFGGMVDEFMDRYAKPNLRDRTVTEYRRTLKGPRTLAWHGKPISSITRRMVLQVLDDLKAEGKHGTARLTLAYFSKFFGWCAEREAITEMPTDRIKVNGGLKPRERALHVGELRRVWAATGKVGRTGGALVRILMLTGQRRFETSVMRWRDISDTDGPSPMWSIPGEVTKNHRLHHVPLVPEAMDVVRSQPLLSADLFEAGAELVFTTNGTVPFSGWSKLKLQVDKAITDDGGEPMSPWTLHDLRRSLVTALNEHGLAQPHVIEAIVNHVSGLRGGIAGVYNRAVYMDERRRALEAWAKLVTNEGHSSNVVPIRAATGRALESTER